MQLADLRHPLVLGQRAPVLNTSGIRDTRIVATRRGQTGGAVLKEFDASVAGGETIGHEQRISGFAKLGGFGNSQVGGETADGDPSLAAGPGRREADSEEALLLDAFAGFGEEDRRDQ